jgi:hypothetical protein
MTINAGTLVHSQIRPYDSADTYPTAFADELKGGYHVVADNTARDATPPERREIGMLVFVISSQIFYQLSGGITNANWAVAPMGSANSNHYVPVSNGILFKDSPISTRAVASDHTNVGLNMAGVYPNGINDTTMELQIASHFGTGSIGINGYDIRANGQDAGYSRNSGVLGLMGGWDDNTGSCILLSGPIWGSDALPSIGQANRIEFYCNNWTKGGYPGKMFLAENPYFNGLHVNCDQSNYGNFNLNGTQLISGNIGTFTGGVDSTINIANSYQPDTKVVTISSPGTYQAHPADFQYWMGGGNIELNNSSQTGDGAPCGALIFTNTTQTTNGPVMGYINVANQGGTNTTDCSAIMHIGIKTFTGLQESIRIRENTDVIVMGQLGVATAQADPGISLAVHFPLGYEYLTQDLQIADVGATGAPPSNTIADGFVKVMCNFGAGLHAYYIPIYDSVHS